VGAANLPDDAGYASKVMGEAQNLRLVAAGRNLPVTVPQADVIVLLRTPAPAAVLSTVPTVEPAKPVDEQAAPATPTVADKVARAG
jgi:hypothetical protein